MYMFSYTVLIKALKLEHIRVIAGVKQCH